MKIVTDHIFPDEPCYGMREQPRLVQIGKASEWRWVQAVYVIRGDAIAEYTKDYGPAERFTHVTPMAMPSFGDDTVAQLQEHFDKNREDNYWQRRSEEMLADSTLIADAIQHLEVEREVLRNRSVIGPVVSVQRNIVPIQRAQREYKELRDARRSYRQY